MDLPYLSPLGPDDLRAAGIPEPWNYGFQDRVRFGEIDILGHVNNAVYLKWFETLRISYFRDLIYPATSVRQGLVVRAASVDFRAEIKPEETYVLTGRTAVLGTTSFTQHYAIWIDGQIRTTGEAIVVTTDTEMKKTPLSDAFCDLFIKIDGATSR